MCLNAVNHLPVECIDHIYMESGHSQMECDSVHSTIESALKTQDVFSPADYYRIIPMARKRNPYKVNVLSTSEFMDFKSLGKSTIKNRNRDINGATVHWLKIKWMRYSNRIYV